MKSSLHSIDLMQTNHLVLMPPVLQSSDDFRALNREQQDAFTARLQHCAEIAASISDHLSSSSFDLLAIIDDSELDALSIMSAANDPAKSVSPYRVHSSWLFECDRNILSSAVHQSTARFLNSPAFLMDSRREELSGWLKDWTAEMQRTFLRFGQAASFSEAVAQLITIDALIANLLVFTAAARLSANNQQVG
jgi:hypothetical protein